LQQHPKLLWQLLCMCSYDNETVFYHEWISATKGAPTDPKIKVLTEIYPDLNSVELSLLANTVTTDYVIQLAEDYAISTTMKKTKPKKVKK
jgi:hypothetical protein